MAVPPTYTEGITLAEHIDDFERGFECIMDFVYRLNEEAPIDCINFPAKNDLRGVV